MKLNQNHEDIFQILENADDETIFHLTRNYSSADTDEMERIFKKSEQKYQIKADLQKYPIQTETAPEQDRNFDWIRNSAALVACFGLAVCGIKGIMNLNPVQQGNFTPATDITETITTQLETKLFTSDFFPETQTNENGYSDRYMSVIPDEDAPETIVQRYLPKWIPEGYTLTQTVETDTPLSVSTIYQNEKGQSFTFHQQLQHNFTGLLLGDSDNHIVYMNINQNPAYYFVTGTQNEGCYLYWKQEGYLFFLETYCISVEDTLKIAESVILQNE